MGEPFQIVSDVYAEDLEALHLLHCSTVDVDRGVLPLLFPEVHDQLLCCVEREVIFLAPLCQGLHLLPVGCLVIVGNQAYYCSVVCNLYDWVRGVRGHSVMGEQGVQERAEHAPLWSRCVEDQRSGGDVSYLHHMVVARQEVQDHVAQGRALTQRNKFNDKLGGYYCVKG